MADFDAKALSLYRVHGPSSAGSLTSGAVALSRLTPRAMSDSKRRLEFAQHRQKDARVPTCLVSATNSFLRALTHLVRLFREDESEWIVSPRTWLKTTIISPRALGEDAESCSSSSPPEVRYVSNFKPRMKAILQDIFNYAAAYPANVALNTAKFLENSTVDEICDNIFVDTVTSVLVAFGEDQPKVQELISLLDKDDNSHPDAASVGIYAVIGVPIEHFSDMPFSLYVGMAWGVKGMIGRTKTHLSAAARAGDPGKILYQHLDRDPKGRRKPVAIALLKTNVINLPYLRVCEAAFSHLLAAYHPTSRTNLARALPSYGIGEFSDRIIPSSGTNCLKEGACDPDGAYETIEERVARRKLLKETSMQLVSHRA